LQVQDGSPAVHTRSFASRQPVPVPQQAVPSVVQEAPWRRQTWHEQMPPAQAVPSFVVAQVRPEQQSDCPVQFASTDAQVWHAPALQTSPTQQSEELAHPCVAALQESQLQPVPPVQSDPSGATQESGGDCVQHSAVAVQDCSCAWHACGTAQVPAMHCSPAAALQQSAVALQFPPVGAHALTDWQEPPVAPGGITQPSPAQQSPFVVQAAFDPAHGGAQTSPTQLLEQHSFATVQPWPFALHELGTWQA
jgi:hypothetical protein